MIFKAKNLVTNNNKITGNKELNCTNDLIRKKSNENSNSGCFD
jgi:hypothetical protein